MGSSVKDHVCRDKGLGIGVTHLSQTKKSLGGGVGESLVGSSKKVVHVQVTSPKEAMVVQQAKIDSPSDLIDIEVTTANVECLTQKKQRGFTRITRASVNKPGDKMVIDKARVNVGVVIRESEGFKNPKRKIDASIDLEDPVLIATLHNCNGTFLLITRLSGETYGLLEETSMTFCLTSPNALVTHVSLSSSDHSLIILDQNPVRTKGKRRFTFDSRWVKEVGFNQVVETAWNSPVEGLGFFGLQKRIGNVRVALLKWKGEHKINSAKVIEECKEKLSLLATQGGFRDWEAWASVKHRRLINRLDNLVRADGRTCDRIENTIDEIEQHFHNLFTTSNPDVENYDMQGIPHSITEAMNLQLTKHVEEEEIKDAVMGMDPNKAPGVDGMSPAFF
ncbi:retrotransposon protein [Striga asiatica]|uniref:Retrotransposon protein n=1 Tax=Striga asiatica TaxID=4170 RepID=A0A5A7QVV6_STRAF|nr:retrotransposon protein [Striga asiatica]